LKIFITSTLKKRKKFNLKYFILFIFCFNYFYNQNSNVTINIGNEINQDEKDKYKFLDNFFNKNLESIFENKKIKFSILVLILFFYIKNLKKQIDEKFLFLEKNEIILLLNSIDYKLFESFFKSKEDFNKFFLLEKNDENRYQKLLFELIFLKNKLEEYSFSGFIVIFYDLFLPYNSSIKILKNKNNLIKKLEFLIKLLIILLN